MVNTTQKNLHANTEVHMVQCFFLVPYGNKKDILQGKFMVHESFKIFSGEMYIR